MKHWLMKSEPDAFSIDDLARVGTEPWSGVRGILDEVWYVDTPAELRMSRLIERHVAFGMDRAAAEAWATGPDEANARLIESTRHRADRIIPWL